MHFSLDCIHVYNHDTKGDNNLGSTSSHGIPNKDFLSLALHFTMFKSCIKKEIEYKNKHENAMEKMCVNL